MYTVTKESTICPVLMLAASRNDRVIGRAEILRISILSKNLFNHPGAPLGINPATNDDRFLVIEEMIIDNHKGRAREKVKII